MPKLKIPNTTSDDRRIIGLFMDKRPPAAETDGDVLIEVSHKELAQCLKVLCEMLKVECETEKPAK